jgi:hypothetical protein
VPATGYETETRLPGDWITGLLRVRPVVLDTGPLTCDVISAAASRSGLPSPLNLAMGIGVVRGFAASHVWAEVPRVLAKRAAQMGLPFEVLERIWWDEYVPLIRFVDCTGLPPTVHAAELARRDPSDSDTLVLAGLLGPVVILAEDKDIVASGLAYEQWRDLYEVASTVARGYTQVRGAALGVVVTGYAVVKVGQAAVWAARTPWALSVAGLGALLLYASAVSWAPRLRASWQRGANGRREFAAIVGEALEAAARRIQEAERTWRAAERGEVRTALIHRVAGVLAVAETPMTRTDLVATLDLTPYRVGMANLARALRGHAAFHEVRPHHWQLGRQEINFGGRPQVATSDATKALVLSSR